MLRDSCRETEKMLHQVSIHDRIFRRNKHYGPILFFPDRENLRFVPMTDVSKSFGFIGLHLQSVMIMPSDTKNG